MDGEQSLSQQQLLKQQIDNLLQETVERSYYSTAEATARKFEKQLSYGGQGLQYELNIKDKINEYTVKSSQFKVLQIFLQSVIIAGAASTSVLLFFPDISNIFLAIISALVALTATVGNIFKFGEHSRNYSLAAEELRQEFNWYETDRGRYKDTTNPEDAVALFMDKTEEINHKYRLRTLSIESQSENIKIKET